MHARAKGDKHEKNGTYHPKPTLHIQLGRVAVHERLGKRRHGTEGVDGVKVKVRGRRRPLIGVRALENCKVALVTDAVGMTGEERHQIAMWLYSHGGGVIRSDGAKLHRSIL